MSLQLFPARLQTWLLTTGLTVAMGAAGGAALTLMWEHQSPWGLARKLETAQGDLTTMTSSRDAFAAAHKDALDETIRWRDSYARLEAARREDAARTAAAVDARAAAQARQCSAAFDSGYAAGRAFATRGTANDPRPDPDPAGPDAGVVRDDFRDAFRSGGGSPSRP